MFFFFGSFDLLCVNLETKVSSQLSSNCNIWWIRPRAKMAAPDWPSHRETPGGPPEFFFRNQLRSAERPSSPRSKSSGVGRSGGVSRGCGRFLPLAISGREARARTFNLLAPTQVECDESGAVGE